MKCVPVLENRYKNIKLNISQSLILEKLQEKLSEYKEQTDLEVLLKGLDRPSWQHAEHLELLASSQKGSDFWLSSSGFHFTPEKGRALKKLGLVGVALHLDHYDPEKHNHLEGYKHAYGWVLKAADSVRKAGLLLGFRLCPSPELNSLPHLLTYARLAKKLNASIVQIVDPAHKLNDRGIFVDLNLEQVQILHQFAEMVNYDTEYKDWPVVSYPESLLQKLDADKQEDQSLCVDAEGKVHACSL